MAATPLRGVLQANEVFLDGTYYPLHGPVQVSLASVFPQKVVQGDFTKDDEQILSNLIMADWKGGWLMRRADLQKAPDRFYYATLDTMHDRQLTLEPYAHPTTPSISGNPDVTTGERYQGQLHAAFARYIRRWDEVAQVWRTPAEAGFADPLLTNPATGSATINTGGVTWFAVSDGVGYGWRRDTPDGAGNYWGYTTGNGTTIPRAQFLAKWDSRLWALDGQNYLWYTLDLVTWVRDAQIPIESGDAQGLLVYFSQQNVSTLYAPTREGLWSYDPGGRVWLQTEASWPAYPSGGKGAATRQGFLYVPVGPALYKFSASVLAPVGLDRDYGLPAQYRGDITAVADAFSFLVAAVNSDPTTAAAASSPITGTVTKCAGNAASTTVTGTGTKFTTELAVGRLLSIPGGTGGITEVRQVAAIANDLSLTVAAPYYNAVAGASPLAATGQTATWVTRFPLRTGQQRAEAPTYDPLQSFGSLFAWNDVGWHHLWSSPLLGQGTQWIKLVAGATQTRLWWSAGGTVYWIKMPRGAFNPRENPDWEYAPSGELVTTWFDGGRIELTKVATELKIRTKGMSATEQLAAYYGLDEDETWQYLTTITTDGETVVRLDNTPLSADPAGLLWKTIRLKFAALRGTDTTKSPVMLFAALKYAQRLDPLIALRFTVDCGRRHGPHEPASLEAALQTTLQKKQLLTLRLRRDGEELVTKKVMLTAYGGQTHTGDETRGTYSLAAVEV